MIVQVLTAALLSGAPAPVPAVQTQPAAAPAGKPEMVCSRERVTGSNVRQTVCVNKREQDQIRRDAQKLVEREQERAVSRGRDALTR